MGFIVRKCSARAVENVIGAEWNIAWLEREQVEETGPKEVAIARVKTVPELDITFGFCEVLRVNKGVGVMYKCLVILEHVLFAKHSILGRVFDEIIQLLSVDFVTRDSRAECIDEGMPEVRPVTRMVTAQCSAILAEG